MFKETPVTKASTVRRKSIYNVGINDADYRVVYRENNIRYVCPFYQRWQNMIKRCYSKINLQKRPSYVGCSVCDEWLTFSNFKKWMIKQDWQGKHLDKDLLVHNNKVYSPSSCIFVSREVNGLINIRAKDRGLYRLGVSFDHKKGLFQSGCNMKGKRINLGSFKLESEAYNAYAHFKSDLIMEVSKRQPLPVRNALKTWIKLNLQSV